MKGEFLEQADVEEAVAVAIAVDIAVFIDVALQRGHLSPLGPKARIVYWTDAWHLSMSDLV